MRKLALTILVLLMVGIFPVVSSAGELEDTQERVRQNPNDAQAHGKLGYIYGELGFYREAATSYQKSIKIKPSEYAKKNLKMNLINEP